MIHSEEGQEDPAPVTDSRDATLDAAATAPPRMFPQWMRRIDPTLAAEDTNGLYRFFLERRVRRTLGGIWGVRLLSTIRGLGSFIKAVIATAFVLAFGIILLMLLTANAAFFILLLIPCLLCYHFIRVARMRVSESRDINRMAPSMHAVINHPRRHRTVLADLWQCGTPGSEIAEVIALEHREDTLTFTIFGYLLSSAILTPLVGVIVRDSAHGWFAMIAYNVLIFSFFASWMIDMRAIPVERLVQFCISILSKQSIMIPPLAIPKVKTASKTFFLVFNIALAMAFPVALIYLQDDDVFSPQATPPNVVIPSVIIMISGALQMTVTWKHRHLEAPRLAAAIRAFSTCYSLFIRAQLSDEEPREINADARKLIEQVRNPGVHRETTH